MIEKLIENAVSKAMAEKLSAMQQEIDASHTRLNMVNERLANLEHYIGLRRHDHTKTDLRWTFQQIQRDLSNNTKPKELDFRNRPLRQAA